MRHFSCWLVLFLFLAQPALANEASAEAPASLPEPKGEKGVERNTTLVETKPSPARLPSYVANWDHLAELTRSDPAVLARADHWAYRREHAIWGLGSVVLLSGGVAAAGTFVRLDTDHWTKTTKWSVAGGLTVAVVSFLTAWAMKPAQVADGPAQLAMGLAQTANGPAMMVRPTIPPSGADEWRRRP